MTGNQEGLLTQFTLLFSCILALRHPMSFTVPQNGVEVTARQAEKKTAEGDNMTERTGRLKVRGLKNSEGDGDLVEESDRVSGGRADH